MAPNPVVAFGSSEDSFYIGCGLQFIVTGVPQSLIDTVKKLPAIHISWLAIDRQAQGWIAYDGYNSTFHYDTEYVTFGATKETHFVKLPAGVWVARNLSNEAVETHRQLRGSIGPNFDIAVTAIIFGKGRTLIYSLIVGFLPLLDSDTKGSRLEKILKEKESDWLIERGSSLCQWNVNYFYLVFKHVHTGKIEIVWELPDKMQMKFLELREYADTPKGKEEIDAYNANELMLLHQRFQMTMAANRSMSQAVSMAWHNSRLT